MAKFSSEQLNFFKFSTVVLDEFPVALRKVFVHMWDTSVASKHGGQKWDNSVTVLNLFLSNESGAHKVPIPNKCIEEWDCTVLFQATLYAQTFATPDGSGGVATLDMLYVKKKPKLPSGTFHPHDLYSSGKEAEKFALALDQLRLLRNTLCHSTSTKKIDKTTLDQYLFLAKHAFIALGQDSSTIDGIGNLGEEDFPTTRVQQLEDELKREKDAAIEFKQIEDHLNQIESEVEGIGKDVTDVKTDLANVRTDVTDVKTDLANASTDITNMKADLADVKTGQAHVESELKETKQAVKVLTTLLHMRIDAAVPEQYKQALLKLIKETYLEVYNPGSTPEENRKFKIYMEKLEARIVSVDLGSLIITVECGSLQILDKLWEDYRTGHLNEMAQKLLVTEKILKEFNLLEVKLTTTILEEEYRACREYFLQFQEHYLREPKRANQETRTRKSQKQKGNLHEEPTKEAQQLIGRQEELKQQKELGKAWLREQLRENENQKQNLERRLKRMKQELREKDEQLREMEEQLTHCKELKDEKQQLINALSEKEKECAHLQQKLSVKLEKLAGLERELRDREHDNVLLQKDLKEAKETVSKYESHLRTCDWVLSRDEIQLTKKILGDGSYARVFEGRYCGSPVAVKKLHITSLSPQERSLFEREMDIASRCRHPCLLQFIGATQDEKSPLFVTELMETSLRALLGKQQLSVTEVSVISLDVARALNYLHQRKPTPIVHRDVSSAKVLLWKQNNQWKGKVSDYGTAKFLEKIMTSAVGALIYRAPEADGRDNQTDKMDVYSFGVLVCEMFIRDLPDFDRRDEQVARVTNTEFRGLIKWCIEEDPEMRPSMEEVIEKLEQFNGMS